MRYIILLLLSLVFVGCVKPMTVAKPKPMAVAKPRTVSEEKAYLLKLLTWTVECREQPLAPSERRKRQLSKAGLN